MSRAQHLTFKCIVGTLVCILSTACGGAGLRDQQEIGRAAGDIMASLDELTEAAGLATQTDCYTNSSAGCAFGLDSLSVTDCSFGPSSQFTGNGTILYGFDSNTCTLSSSTPAAVRTLSWVSSCTCATSGSFTGSAGGTQAGKNVTIQITGCGTGKITLSQTGEDSSSNSLIFERCTKI